MYVFGLFNDPRDARRAIAELRDLGVAGEDVGVVMPSREEAAAAADGTGAAPREVVPTAALGGLLGGFTGWLVGLAALSVPGVGPLLAAGTFGAAMAGAGLGVGLGALAGALGDMGVPEGQREALEREVAAGNTLVSVQAGERGDEVAAVLARHGATDPSTPSIPVVPPGPA
jgi:hypothetical protein